MSPVDMGSTEQCIFCKIVSGDAPCHKVWESASYLAFLSIFPNTKGMTVVIPKKHYPSYAFEMPEDSFISLVQVAKKVALLLDEKLAVGRTALIFEGFGVDHVHAKLYPLHGGPKSTERWRAISSSKDDYFEVYPGYISSHDGKRANNEELAQLAEMLRS